MAFDSPKTLLLIEQYNGQPALAHGRVAMAFDVSLAVSDAPEQASIGLVEWSVLRSKAGAFNLEFQVKNTHYIYLRINSCYIS